MTLQRKKLIEVSIPLDAINKASAREKSIRHGHPSTLHLWWARRPLAACRAVLFTQLVDDPSGWPEEFPTEEAQNRERKRLHRIIEELVPWEATNDERILGRARYEIARSMARAKGDSVPSAHDAKAVLAYLAEHAPPVCDPFCGGGSIPLEAQRLGLRAHGSDLNPVAVLVSKATCEIPPKFAGFPPVNPERDSHVHWKGAQGLADDIRYYGKWMRDEAKARIGHLYPKVRVSSAMAAERPDLKPYAGKELTVIAWLWVRTVASPDPMVRGAHVPLASSFALSSKTGKEAIVVPVIDRVNGTYRFTVKARQIGREELARARAGTKTGRGANFRCLSSGSPITRDHIRSESMGGRMGSRLMAVVAEGTRGRVYLEPSPEQETIGKQATPKWKPDQAMNRETRDLVSGRGYGFFTWADLFTDRQLVALTTFSDLVSEARERVLTHALKAGMDADAPRLADGGVGAEAYADAVATYLGLSIGRASDAWSSITSWRSGVEATRGAFARQALPMVWDFAEANPFSAQCGNWIDACVKWISKYIDGSVAAKTEAAVIQLNAAGESNLVCRSIVATDPPYYDNIGYADLSDFFYVWQRRTLRLIWPGLFRRVLTPKDEELVATPYRHGGRQAAETFFMEGMAKALRNMFRSSTAEYPITIYYAFKQSEIAEEGITSPGWASFLQGIVDAGYVIDGTWPVRTERSARSISIGTNALASSVVLVGRKRAVDASIITRREFVARLRAAMPDALAKIREGGVGPVDMAQAAIGPGMGVFTAASKVLEPDDTPMTVRTAIALINQVRDEISGEEASSYDPETRFCIDWFETFGMESGKSGEAITMAQAYDIGVADLDGAGVFHAQGGTARLLRRDELPEDWDPTKDKRLTDWECAQHLVRALESPEGGMAVAGDLYSGMGAERGERARMLAYRLYDISERKKFAAEARAWNMLVQEWSALEEAASNRMDVLSLGAPGTT